MRTWSVFEPPVATGDPLADADRLVFVRHGWSLAALFLPVVWMLVRRLWWVLLAYILVLVGIQLLSFAVPPLVTAALSVALALALMLEAGQLRLESMALRGYREIAVIEARNRREAERQFFARWLAAGGGVSRGEASRGAASRLPVLRPASTTPPPLPGMGR